ncbi:diaminopimelate decarboxylase [Sinomonas notoginsengisoli]|uniref:diaminopimelate decarboxylase n=1 Tax=Sinomonas notoginsengisoli TaxID=1457311 RepID=UPI001F48BD94|nr:diaminopimelate decarboxylase [Sinomonas notoginsengisoli]
MAETTRKAVAAPSPLAPEWLSVPEDLNELLPALWAHDAARTAGGELALGGLTATEIKAQFGSPVFVLSEADFRARARAFKTAFDAAFADICGGVDVYYAGKSFLCTAIARWVREEGLRLDTASGGELAVAERAGTPGELIGLHGNNKSDAEIRRALDLGAGRIIVDSLDELDRVAAIAAARGTDTPGEDPGMESPRAKVMLRLTPGVHAHTHEFIATAHEDQKFGLSMAPGTASAAFADEEPGSAPSMAEEAVAAAAGHDSIELLGVHCHIGSQIFEPEGFEAAAVRLLEFVAAMRALYGVALPELDLGGGYGIAYVPGDTPRPPAEIATALAGVVRETCARLRISAPRISIEPGRAIVGSTTFTLYEVGTIKDVVVDVPAPGQGGQATGETSVRRYISVDGGMSDNARPVLYDADYSVILANRTSQAPAQLVRVVGKHCESGDIVVRDAYLPGDVRAGDLLAVPGTGAYCWALSSNYNYLARPGVLAVRDGAARWIVRGETEDDLLSRDMGV